MSVRTTSSDPVGFIYDSVTGLAIGECWEDDEKMDQFLEWYNNPIQGERPDMRGLTPEELQQYRNDFEQIWIKS